MNLQFRIAMITVACTLSRGAASQSRPAADPIGTWRGTSLCLVRPSACNDERVVYRVTRAGAPDSVSIDALKIVNGQEEDMGTLGCRYATAEPQVICVIPSGIWRFTVRGDSLVGDLKRSDGTRFRDVRTARSR